MNRYCFRLVFNQTRNTLIAGSDHASSRGNGAARGAGRACSAVESSHIEPAISLMAWAAMLLLGTASNFAIGQIVAAPGSGAQVIQTQNGLPQVNISRPSGAGVSINTYSQFDVQKPGAILNNSPTLVQTQQAGYINGNPNLSANGSARIIVNQVMSNAPSQLRGYVEVAGPRAEVVIANGDQQTSKGDARTSSPSDFQAAADQPFNDSGLSAAARAWDKHAGRAGGTFEPLTGSTTDKNAAASQFVNQVLNDPATTRTELSRGRVEFRSPNGQGIRFNADGSFSGVLDPRK